jgi:hypothetical protein
MKRRVKLSLDSEGATSPWDTLPVSARGPHLARDAGESESSFGRIVKRSSPLAYEIQRGASRLYSRSLWHLMCRRTRRYEGGAAPS